MTDAKWMRHGESHYAAKLNDAAVVEILRRARAGEKYMLIALDFAVSDRTVGKIVNGRMWTHVTHLSPRSPGKGRPTAYVKSLL